MMAVKKKSVVALIVFVLLLGAGAYLYMNANSLIVRTTERIAGNALGVPVHIGSINLSWANKSITVNALKIGNPPGYHQPNIITASSISVGLSTASKTLVDFKNIEVKGVEVFFEMTPQGTNLMDLKKLAAGKKQTNSTGSETIRVIIQQMVVDASVIHPSIAILNRDIPAITMPAVHLSSIGQKNGGSDAKDVIVQVLTQYLTTAQQAVANSGILKQLPNVDDAKKMLNDKAAGKLKQLF
jgi:hypothetical protein